MMDAITVDTSIRRIVITEDEDLDLDKLLLVDNSGSKLAVVASPPSSPRPTLTPPSSLPTLSTSTLASVQSCISQNDTTPASPIQAREDEDDEVVEGGYGHWVMPAPAQPGDYLTNSLHKVPSKSILKKTSSYGNFDQSTSSANKDNKRGLARKASSFLSFHHLDSSQSSTGSRGRVANSALDSSLAGGVNKMAKKTSYLSLESSNSINSQGNHSQVAIGWDLDDSSPAASPAFLSTNKFVPGTSLPAMPSLAPDGNASDADRAAGMDSSSSRHSVTSSPKIRRTVSFNSVNVREYDRTVGDNPSCRSGPPMSLDWSYSKKYEKNLDEYELERSSERVTHLRKLHVNKWKRRNMLAYTWGHTEDEMKAARKATKKMQRQRSVTKTLLPLHMAEEAFIGLKNIITKKKGNSDAAAWSDLSNSASTKDSTTQRYQQRYSDTVASSAPSVGDQELPAGQKVAAAVDATIPLDATSYQFTRRTRNSIAH